MFVAICRPVLRCHALLPATALYPDLACSSRLFLFGCSVIFHPRQFAPLMYVYIALVVSLSIRLSNSTVTLMTLRGVGFARRAPVAEPDQLPRRMSPSRALNIKMRKIEDAALPYPRGDVLVRGPKNQFLDYSMILHDYFVAFGTCPLWDIQSLAFIRDCSFKWRQCEYA